MPEPKPLLSSDRTFIITVFPAPEVKARGPGPDHADGVFWTSVGEQVEFSIEKMDTLLTTPVVAPGKYASPYYVGGALEGGRRRLAAVASMALLSLDIEGGPTIEEAHEVFEPFHHVIYTSWRHDPQAHRFRLVLPLASDVSSEDYRVLWDWAAARMGHGVDSQAKDPSRALFLPAIKPDGSQAVAQTWSEAPLLVPAPILEKHHRNGATLEHEKSARHPSRPPPRRVYVSEDRARSLARYRLCTDRGTRERAAVWLEANLCGVRAERIACPSCGRPSVWFYLEPGAKGTASCNHLNSCGWWGHLDELLDMQGGPHGR